MLKISFAAVFLGTVVDVVRFRAAGEAVLLVDARPPRAGLVALERLAAVEVVFLGGMTTASWGGGVKFRELGGVRIW